MRNDEAFFSGPSAIAVFNKIYQIDRDAMDAIEKMFDIAIAEEANRKRNLRDIFTSKAFWQGLRDGLAAPLMLFAGPQERQSRLDEVRSRYAEPDRLFWKVLADYCASKPEILDKLILDSAEQEKLNKLMNKPNVKMGDEHALQAG
jgi:hypothetical protein